MGTQDKVFDAKVMGKQLKILRKKMIKILLVKILIAMMT